MDPQRLAPRTIAAAVAIGLVAELLLRGHSLGINLLLVTAAFIAATVAIRPSARPLDRLDLWLPAAALLLSAFAALRADEPLIAVDTLGVVGLLGGWVGAAAGAPITRRGIAAAVEVAILVIGSACVRAASALRLVRLGSVGSGFRDRHVRRATPVARGLLIVLPFLVIFAGLFASADPIFREGLDRLTRFDVELGEIPERAVFVLVVAWLAGGLLWMIGRGEVGLEARSLGAAAAPAVYVPRLGATEAVTALIALDLLFGAFVVLQLVYLFGGLETLSVVGLTYAEYARRGFFELLAVSFIVGGLVMATEALIAHRTRAYVAALVGLLGLTGVVLASSFLRLRLYQDIYGWTELRFWVLAAIVFLAMCGVAATVTVLADRSRWLPHGVIGAGFAVLVGINIVGPQAYITDRNLDRALNPGLVPERGETTLDSVYLASFGADAVPALVAAYPRLPQSERLPIVLALRELQEREYSRPAEWPDWNLSRERARAALASAFGELPRRE